MLIACTIEASAMAIESQLNEIPTTKLKGLSDYNEFLSKSHNTSKGPQI